MTETSPRIARLLRDLPGRGAQALADFWREAAATGTPLVEQVDGGNALVTFVWRGQAAETIAGWGVDVTLRRVPGTDLWHGSQRLPMDLRTLYFLAHGREDVLTIPTQPTGTGPTHLDPLNRRPFRFPADRTDPNDRPCWASLLELPAAPSEQWSQPGPGVDRGTFLPTSIRTAALGGRRRVGVYRPAGAGDEPLPVVVIFDGYLSRRVLRIPTTLDNLIAAGLIPPTMALFVNAPSGARRFRELRPGAAIRTFVVRELMPWAGRRWAISDDRRQRVIAGSSLGGLAAAYVALVAPHQFGAVISQSGSFWWPAQPAAVESEWLTREYTNRPADPVRFYLDVGDRETASPRPGQLDQVAVNRRLRDALVERGYQVSYSEYSGAHDYVNWRRTFPDGLRTLLGPPDAHSRLQDTSSTPTRRRAISASSSGATGGGGYGQDAVRTLRRAGSGRTR